MKRKVRVYKPMAQQGIQQQQQQAPDPQLIIGSVVNSLSNTMDEKGNVDYATLDQIQIELEKLYGTEGANQIIQQALDQIKVGQTQQTPAQQAGPQAMIDLYYNPFAEQEAMNQQIIDEALTETPVDLVARRGLQTYQGHLNSQVEDGQAMGDFYADYVSNPTALAALSRYNSMSDNPAATALGTFVSPLTLSRNVSPFYTEPELQMINEANRERQLMIENANAAAAWDRWQQAGADKPTSGYTPASAEDINAATIWEQSLNPDSAVKKTVSLSKKKQAGGMTKGQYAKNVMNYMKQAGGMQEAEMVDNTDTLNGREQMNSNFINTLHNQSQMGAVNQFAEDTYDQFNDFMQRGGQRRAMRQANRAMRRAGRAMRGMPMIPGAGFMGMPMTPFGPANPFVSQFLPVNATASTNINPYGIESIEHTGRGLFRRPTTTINFFNPYDYMDRAVVDAETVDVVTETPVDGNNDSMDGKVQSQAKTNTEVEQVEAHSQKKDNSKSGKKEAVKAEVKAEELDQSNTVTNKDPRLAAMQEWKETQARRQAQGRDLSTGEFNPYSLYPNQGMWENAMGELYSQNSNEPLTPEDEAWLAEFNASMVGPDGYPIGTPDYAKLEQRGDSNYSDAFFTGLATLGIGPGMGATNAAFAGLKPFVFNQAIPGAATRALGAGAVRQQLPAAVNAAKNLLGPGARGYLQRPAAGYMGNIPLQVGGMVNPDLYKYVYGAQKKKAIDFELPEAQSGFWIGSGQGLPPVYDQGQAYNPVWRYDKRSQAPNFVGSLLFGAAGAGLDKPVEYAGSWIKHKGNKGTYTGQPVSSIKEWEDLKGRGKKWEVTRGTDAPKRKIKGDKQMPQFMDTNAPMTDEQYIKMMQGDQPGRRRAADFFYKLGQKSGLNPEKNLFTKIGTKFEPWEEIPTDVQQAMQPAKQAPQMAAPDYPLYTEFQEINETPIGDQAMAAPKMNAPSGPLYTETAQMPAETRLAPPAPNYPLMTETSQMPDEQRLMYPSPDYPVMSGDFASIQEPFYPGFGPYALEDTTQYPSMIDMAGIQQGQDYDRQSAYEDYVRRSMENQDMAQRGVYGQDLIDQEFANKSDWFEVGIPQIQANQARRAAGRIDMARGKGSGRTDIPFNPNAPLEEYSYGIPYTDIMGDPLQTAGVYDILGTDYSSMPDDEFFMQVAPTLQSLVSQQRMESNPILSESLRRDIYALQQELARRGYDRTGRMNPTQLRRQYRSLAIGGSLNKYQGSMASQVTSTQQGSSYPGGVPLLPPPDYPLYTEMADPTQFGDDRYSFDGRLNTLPLTTIDSSAPTADEMQRLGMTPTTPEGSFKQKFKRKDMTTVNFPVVVDWINAGGHGLASILENAGRDWKKFSSDELTATQKSRDKGTHHFNTGLSVEDRFGSGLQFQAKKGGTYKEGQVTYLSEDQIREIIENGGEIEFV